MTLIKTITNRQVYSTELVRKMYDVVSNLLGFSEMAHSYIHTSKLLLGDVGSLHIANVPICILLNQLALH